MNQHTPTPWVKIATPHKSAPGPYAIVTLDDEFLADPATSTTIAWMESGGECDRDAEFIVRAVNNHDALLAVLETVRQAMLYNDRSPDGQSHPWIPGGAAVIILPEIEAAISQARR